MSRIAGAESTQRRRGTSGDNLLAPVSDEPRPLLACDKARQVP